MGVRDYKKLGGSDESNRVQDNVETALRPILASPIVNGVLLTGVTLANGVTTVEHKLGRTLRGWIIVGQNANASIWDSQAGNNLAARTLILNSNAIVTVNIWCF